MKQTLLAATLIICMAGVSTAQDNRAAFKNISMLQQSDPSAAFKAALSLAEKRYPPAIDRVGYYFRHGIGTDRNLEAARDWYARAVAAEHPWSTASLARVEIELNRGDVALQLLEAAVLEDLPGTLRLLATSHIDGDFGVASDPQSGRKMLESLSVRGDQNAARELVVRINWHRLSAPASDIAIAQVVQAGLAGEVRFAETALVYLARHGKKNEETLGTRFALANIPGVRDRVLSPELIRLAADAHPAQFWSKSEEILEQTETENYATTASVAFWINKNAWVRVLQKELRLLGYYKGRINGRMTSSTIKAQNRFCRDENLWHICANGPLRGATVRALAGAIAAHKRPKITL
ncbi:hypothetical protein [Roseobacter sp.]|uniref:hypothetical protein n=1 Tax=Roseobacter sp. TaxID=1907202 RepID=UPI00385FA66D